MFWFCSVRYNVVFCRPQEQVVHVLWPVCCARVRRSALHEGEAEAEPASAFSAVVTQPGYLQVSHLLFFPSVLHSCDLHFHCNRATRLKVCLLFDDVHMACVGVRGTAINTHPLTALSIKSC